MKNKLKTKDFKWFSTKVFLLCLFMAFGSSQVFAQCNYVTLENSKETKASIFCDFPVLLKTDKPETDKADFNTALHTWYVNNPSIMISNIIPKSVAGNYFIEIPFSAYSQFSVDRKKAVDAIPYFYKVIQERK